jgi:hypothetical protein
VKIAAVCLATARSVTTSRAAIAALERPSAISPRTSRSRGLSLDNGLFAAVLRASSRAMTSGSMMVPPSATRLTASVNGYFRPFLADGQVSEMLPLAFALLGVVFAAWTLFAFAAAAFLGTVLRRTVPAMAVTIVSYIALDLATATAIRPHYATPVTVRGWNGGAGGGWVLSSWAKAPDGQVLSQADLNSLSQHLPASVQNSPGPDAFTGWLTQHGYTLWQSVQPDSRFWQFQLTEGGWLLAVSAVLIAGTVWLVRRRGA